MVNTSLTLVINHISSSTMTSFKHAKLTSIGASQPPEVLVTRLVVPKRPCRDANKLTRVRSGARTPLFSTL